MSQSKWSALCGCGLLVFLCMSPAAAQIGGGSIVGTVVDPSGAPVARVRIESHNQDTNETQQATTNGEGYYEFPLLPAGRYHLEAESPAFTTLHGPAFALYHASR